MTVTFQSYIITYYNNKFQFYTVYKVVKSWENVITPALSLLIVYYIVHGQQTGMCSNNVFCVHCIFNKDFTYFNLSVFHNRCKPSREHNFQLIILKKKLVGIASSYIDIAELQYTKLFLKKVTK